MSLDLNKYGYGKKTIVRDIRPIYIRFGEWLQRPTSALSICLVGFMSFFMIPEALLFSDLIFIFFLLFFWWLKTRDRALPAKLPLGAPYKDTNNITASSNGEPEGILFIGNEAKTREQIWYTNSDARTHILYLGTTGSGKTEGLKSFATSALLGDLDLFILMVKPIQIYGLHYLL